MSLINDALKRAGQKPVSAPSASETVAGLQPVEDRPNSFPVLTLLIVLIPLIALGVWFLAKGLQMNDQNTRVQPETVAARTAEASQPVVAPIAGAAVPTNSTPAAISPLPGGPVYKLQGIYWRPSRPSAVVNSKTVYIGDRVEKGRVTAIDQESVTISVDGQAKVLLLP